MGTNIALENNMSEIIFLPEIFAFFKNNRQANKRIVLHVFSMSFHHY